MSIDLAITLGHNSSCVCISSETGEILCGFEEERLSGIKSDSAYPIQSIELCMKVLNRPSVRSIYISHWFADGRLKRCKYFDPGHLSTLQAKEVINVSKDFTHHDAHNYSAVAFAQSAPGFEDDFHSFVVDGFGTQGECFSIYEATSSTSHFAKTRLLHRAFGYHKSLGLLYQYATAFLGMKMQQDEYKLLGYEAQVEADIDTLDIIASMASTYVDEMVEKIDDQLAIDKDQDPIVNLNALQATKDNVFTILWKLLEEFDIDDRTDVEAKIAVALFVQFVVEEVITHYVKKYRVRKLICSGGVFMNVKLNMRLSKIVDKLCVMPLAGDQGAALGLYHYHRRNLKWPGHLYWGTRFWDGIDKFEGIDGVKVFTDHCAFVNAVVQELNSSGYVNVVTGDMEYGPRALCNTSTLAIPTENNTAAINSLNDRTTIMPMAPVMTSEMADKVLKPEYTRYHLSLNYMIGACELKPDVTYMDGATNIYDGQWFSDYVMKTSRPQILDSSHPVYDVLQNIGMPLINTSFNYHGVPIVYSVDDIISTHQKQNQNGTIKTYIFVEHS